MEKGGSFCPLVFPDPVTSLPYPSLATLSEYMKLIYCILLSIMYNFFPKF